MSSSTIPRPVTRTWIQRINRTQWVLLGIIALIIVAAIIAFSLVRSQASEKLATQPVVRQTLVQTVSASGTVNPQNTITVGSQVSGNISGLFADYNSQVKKGQILATIDPSTLNAQLNQAQAALAQAEASAAAGASTAQASQAGIIAQTQSANAAQSAIATASASVTRAQSGLQLAQTTVTRDQALLAQGYLARSQVQTDQDAVVQAQSTLATAQATLAQMRAQASQSTTQIAVTKGQASASSNQAAAQAAAVRSAQAQVQQAALNVKYATIKSPVDGTVISRAVSIGQTVAAGFSAPVLFTIAQDLHKMEVDIAVGEPDIGSIKAGQNVTFAVLAYPNENFTGVVTQVRVNPTTTSGVVTYTVITQVNNNSGKLLPGMTATALIQVANAPNALVVPTTALQWQPPASGGRRRPRGTAGAGAVPSAVASASPWGQSSGAGTAAVVTGTTGNVYVQHPGFGPNGLTQVPVRVLLVNGTQAAVAPVQSGALNAGDQVIVGAASGPGAAITQRSAVGGMGRMFR